MKNRAKGNPLGENTHGKALLLAFEYARDAIGTKHANHAVSASLEHAREQKEPGVVSEITEEAANEGEDGRDEKGGLGTHFSHEPSARECEDSTGNVENGHDETHGSHVHAKCSADNGKAARTFEQVICAGKSHYE